MDACLMSEHSLLGKRRAVFRVHPCKVKGKGRHTLKMDLGSILISQGKTWTETTSVRARSDGDMLGVMSDVETL